MVSILFMPLVFGIVGAFTPCAPGINAVFLGRIAGKSKQQRLTEWLLFTLTRAAFLAILGLAFGLLGQLVGDFVRGYQVIIAYGLILLVALCSCRQSDSKPFCDGMHQKIGFEAK